MQRRDALKGLTASGLAAAGFSATATAASQPEFVGLRQGVSFEPAVGSTETGEAYRVDLNQDQLTGRVLGAVRYSSKTDTNVEFIGFDDQAPVDVAEFEFQRGDLASDVYQTVSFEAKFSYEKVGEINDLFVDLKGATPA